MQARRRITRRSSTPASEQTFKVPTGVTQLTVVARGGEGAGFSVYPSTDTPGRPGRVYAIIPVRAGDKLYVFVGGSGTHGGFNGGGAPSHYGSYGRATRAVAHRTFAWAAQGYWTALLSLRAAVVRASQRHTAPTPEVTEAAWSAKTEVAAVLVVMAEAVAAATQSAGGPAAPVVAMAISVDGSPAAAETWLRWQRRKRESGADNAGKTGAGAAAGTTAAVAVAAVVMPPTTLHKAAAVVADRPTSSQARSSRACGPAGK